MADPGTSRSDNAGWHPDPTDRFELRYHNGRSWTADVSTDGQRFVDPAGSRRGPTIPAAQPVPPASNPRATAAMVLGIVSIGIGWMPFVVALGAIAAVLALAFGVTGRRQARATGTGGGFAVAGIATGAVGLLVCVGGVFFSVSLLQAVDRFENPAANETAITGCTQTDDEISATGTITNTSDDTASFTLRIHFVRAGTDNPVRQANVTIDDLASGASGEFEVTRATADVELECTIGAVRGPLPYGVDPGT